ncbi:MAG TPA: hypothetical protein VFU63_14810, partial [Ktedonobacterales bacterium]|nr:hypothetical protein [Ktedonobacterales bacterium]
MPPRYDYDDRWPEPERSSPSRRRPRGLPLWSKGSIAVGVILALVAAFLARAVIQHGDWSDGMLALAPTAALLAAITLLVGIVRIATGHRTRWTLLQTMLLIIVL